MMTYKDIAVKLHGRFAHPPADQLLQLVKQSDYAHDEELKSQIKTHMSLHF